MTRLDHAKYTMAHRKAFRILEKQLCGKVSLRGYLHDLDKVFLYFILGKEKTSRFHKLHARHHQIKAKSKEDYIEMVIDWECCRYTKPDKPMNAYETLYSMFPELESKILPILVDFGLAHPQNYRKDVFCEQMGNFQNS